MGEKELTEADLETARRLREFCDRMKETGDPDEIRRLKRDIERHMDGIRGKYTLITGGSWYTAADLFQSKNPIILAVLSAWKQGEFPTFEQALITAVVLLKNRNIELVAQSIKKSWEEPQAFIVPGKEE
jgi:hypothetical protein